MIRHANPILFAIAIAIAFLMAIGFDAGLTRAKEIRLIGYCEGKLLAAMEEDNFPTNCDWIEKVNYHVE